MAELEKPPLTPENVEQVAQQLSEEHQEQKEQELELPIEQEVEQLPEPNPLEDRISRLEGTLTDLRMENQYLKGALVQQRPPQQQVQEEEDVPSEEEIEAGLKANPAGTIRQLIKAAEKRGEDRVEKRLRQTQGQQTQLNQDFQKDEAMFQSLYGELFQSHKEFNRAANAIYDGLVRTFGNVPGLKAMAGSTAYGQLAREGKIQVEVKENGGMARQPVNVKGVVRKIANDPQIRSNAANRQTPASDPLSSFTKDEQDSIRRVCKNLGITEADWKRNYDEAKKENPEYA